MTIYYNDKQSTQAIKEFLSPNTRGKLLDNTEYKENKEKTLPVRSTPEKKVLAKKTVKKK